MSIAIGHRTEGIAMDIVEIGDDGACWSPQRNIKSTYPFRSAIER